MNLKLDNAPVDFSKFVLSNPPGDAYRRRSLVGCGLSRRVPDEIATANGLVIKCLCQPCCGGSHLLISANGLELCPIRAMMFLAAAKLYRWSDGLDAAIKKIMEVSEIESYSKCNGI